MLVSAALTRVLCADSVAGIVTTYEIAVAAFRLYRERTSRGEVLELDAPVADKRVFGRLVAHLEREGVLTPFRAVPGVYELPQGASRDPRILACSLDPFCALSHLSAMTHHGVSDRTSRTLFVSTPKPGTWRQRALERMERDTGGGDALSDYLAAHLPRLVEPVFDALVGAPVHRHRSDRAGGFVAAGPGLRVTSVGRTFLDMVRRPDLCGGIHHVIEAYEAHASTYLRLIANEVDAHGTQIDKVRAGYLLAEVCGLHDDVVASWQRYAQRGGSRRLDPAAPYDGVRFSEAWALSLNV